MIGVFETRRHVLIVAASADPRGVRLRAVLAPRRDNASHGKAADLTSWSKHPRMGVDACIRRRPWSSLTAWIAATAVFAVTPARVLGCASCACGDPTLTVMGAEQPFAGRLRVAFEGQFRSDAVGRETVDRVALQELRTSLSVAYAPLRSLMLSLSLPFIGRELTDVTLARERLFTVGDLELHARAFFWRDREFAPTHLLGAAVGLRLPTGPLLRDPNGAYREPELQPGTGSFDPSAGLTYLMSAEPWSLFVSEVVYVPTRGAADFRVGVSWRGTHALQYQLWRELAARVGINHRLEARSQRGSAPEPDSGGLISFVSVAAVWNPAEDLVLIAELQLPVVNALHGVHDEGAFATVGAVYDL